MSKLCEYLTDHNGYTRGRYQWYDDQVAKELENNGAVRVFDSIYDATDAAPLGSPASTDFAKATKGKAWMSPNKDGTIAQLEKQLSEIKDGFDLNPNEATRREQDRKTRSILDKIAEAKNLKEKLAKDIEMWDVGGRKATEWEPRDAAEYAKVSRLLSSSSPEERRRGEGLKRDTDKRLAERDNILRKWKAELAEL